MSDNIFDDFPDDEPEGRQANGSGRQPFYGYPPPPPLQNPPPARAERAGRNGWSKGKAIGFSFLIVLLVLAMFLTGFFVSSSIYGDMQREMPELYRTYKYIKAAYIKDLDWETFQYSVVQAMLGELDPYSWLEVNSASYSAPAMLGITIASTAYNEHYVSRVYEGGAVDMYNSTRSDTADMLLRGDRIYSVGGVRIENVNQNSGVYSGAFSGDTLNLEFYKYGDFELKGATVTKSPLSKVSTVTYEAKEYNGKPFGYIDFTTFDGETSIAEMDAAIDKYTADAKATGANKLVLDLRKNGGGAVSVVQAVAPYFTKDRSAGVNTNDGLFLMRTVSRASGTSPVYSIADKGNGVKRRYLGDTIDGFELVVLVGEGSASAAEVLTANIKYYCPEHTVVGKKTYGKGVAQAVIELNSTYDIVLTTATYDVLRRDANGTTSYWNYHGVGITPDITAGGSDASEVMRNDIFDEESMKIAMGLLF